MATGGGGGGLLNDPTTARTLTEERDSIRSVALLEGGCVAWSGHDGSVKMVTAHDGGKVEAFRVHDSAVTFLKSVWNREGLASGSVDGTMRVWLPFEGTLVTEVTWIERSRVAPWCRLSRSRRSRSA